MISQTMAAEFQGNRRDGRGRVFAGLQSGFRGLGELSNSLVYTASDIRQIQEALNRNPSKLPPLVVDGIIGSKTLARIHEFQSQIGYAQQDTLQPPLLAVLGLTTNYGDPYWQPTAVTVGGQAGTPSDDLSWSEWLGSIFGVSPASAVGAGVGAIASATQQEIDQAKQIVNSAANSGSQAVKDSLKFLADHGDLFAKFALAVGVSYGVAQAIAIGGGGFILIMLLKKT